MPVLDVILILALAIVAYLMGQKAYGVYIVDKMNRSIIELHPQIPFFNREECREASEILDDAEEAGANMRFVTTARELIEITRRVLDAQTTIKDGL